MTAYEFIDRWGLQMFVAHVWRHAKERRKKFLIKFGIGFGFGLTAGLLVLQSITPLD